MMKTNYRPCFPQRLFLLLKLVEDKGLDHIVSWVDDGSAFKVHDLKKFQHELLPKYFSTKKYASFTRQLCAYGFSCLRTGRQTGIYSHPGFHRDDPASSFQIKRESAKSKAKTAIANKTKVTTVKAPEPPVEPAIPQGVPMTFEFPAVFGNSSGRYTSSDHYNQLGELHKLLCTPIQNSAQPAMTSLYRRSVSSVSLPSDIEEESRANSIASNNGITAEDLEPIPVFSRDDTFLGQNGQRMNGISNSQTMPSLNFVPLSPEIYSETKQIDLDAQELLAPMMEPRSMNVTPI